MTCDAFEIRSISSLEKVFADEALQAKPLPQGSALAGEVYAFQVAICSAARRLGFSVQLISPLREQVTLR